MIKCKDGWCRYEYYDCGVGFCRICGNIKPEFTDDYKNKLLIQVFEQYKKHIEKYKGGNKCPIGKEDCEGCTP